MMKQRSSIVGVLLLTALACGRERQSDRDSSRSRASVDSADSAFAGVQARGRTAMGVDQYTSRHRFESLPDGGRITLTRDPQDTAGAARIRAHMSQIAAAFGQGNFDLPGFVHDREVPGTAVMRARREYIRYVPDSSAGGGALRITSRDSVAIAAVHEFLAFQRRDHRAGDHSHR
jgi:hypothetical protein